MTTTEQLKEFLDIARQRVKECGESRPEPCKKNSRCNGCPAHGMYAGEYEDCVYYAALDVGRGY